MLTRQEYMKRNNVKWSYFISDHYKQIIPRVIIKPVIQIPVNYYYNKVYSTFPNSPSYHVVSDLNRRARPFTPSPIQSPEQSPIQSPDLNDGFYIHSDTTDKTFFELSDSGDELESPGKTLKRKYRKNKKNV